MKATEIIERLQQVAPDTDVTITTATGTWPISEIRTLGYSDGKATILADD